jgi:hypothetical protein
MSGVSILSPFSCQDCAYSYRCQVDVAVDVLYIIIDAMEKNNDLPVNEDYGAIASQDEKRRSSMAESPSRAVRTVVFIIILCLGLARVTGVFEPKDYVPLSIAERAKVILKGNPLIGRSHVSLA